MENGQKILSELFGGRRIFNIPKYQRAFAWDEKKQLTDFLEDLHNQRIGRDYFLGTILFQEKPDREGGFELIDIVDGQQRITSIIIFMKVLIDKLAEYVITDEDETLELLSETYIKYRNQYKLRVLQDDNDFFQNYILSDEDGKDFIRTPSQKRLYKAKIFFENSLNSAPHKELAELKTKIDENTKVLTYSVKDTAEATLIFETTNDRGKGLTNLEKIKSFLMYKCYLAEKKSPDEILDTIQYRFSEIYKEYEKIASRIDEDSILQYHFIAFEKWTVKEDYQNNVTTIKNHINSLLKQGKDSEVLKFIDRYTKELKESYMTVVHLLQNEDEPVRDIFLLERPGNFYPLLIKTYKLDNTSDKVHFLQIARLIEIYCFRVYAINQNRSNTGQSSIYTLTRGFKGKFPQLVNELKALTKKYSWNNRFENHLRTSNSYEWMNSRDLNYLFWKYENHLRVTEQPLASKMSEKEFRTKSKKFRLTIEHIAPQTRSEAKVIIDKSILPKMTEKFKENFLHSIGNLTIDPQSANSSKGNLDFKIKNSKYFARAPFKTQNELDTFLVGKKWDQKAISKREDKIVGFALDYWNPDNI